MKRVVWIAGCCFGICVNFGVTQTTVTTNGGTQNKIPKFTGNATISDSAITEVNGNVGIGTASPDSLLGVGNGFLGNSFHSVVGGGYAGLFENVYSGFGAGGKLLWVKSVNQNSESYHFLIEGNNNPELLVRGDGKVGIATIDPTAPLDVAAGWINSSSQVLNALTVHPNGGSAYGENGTSIYLGAMTNHGTAAVAGIWSALGSGGDGGINYNGALVLGTVDQGSAAPIEHMRIAAQGNIGIGTKTPQAPLEVNGNIALTSGSGAHIVFPDGSQQSVAWNGTLCGGDYAESVDVSGDRKRYEPGDVLVIDSKAEGRFLKSDEPYSTRVMGIYSTKPGLTGRRQTTAKNPDEVPMAMMGIVPTKVSAENGPIHPGDLLVTSSTIGYAMKGTDRGRMIGALIGKALGSLDSGTGVIEVGVTLQ